MTSIHRPRRLVRAALTAALMLGLTACDTVFPNTTFDPNTEFGRDIDRLWSLMLVLGTIVFVGVEVGLIYVLWRFRRREGAPEPKHVHGNTTLEITWTAIPAIVLIFIAVPTVRTIFRTQAEAAPGSLTVEVIGHQWWWEFRYPDLGIVTANELYLPVGQTVNFKLNTADVIHSFWIPQLGGKRDLITNHTNYLWFTPDSTLESSAWNGFCAEYCGTSHADMRFRVYTVQPDEFQRWAEHQRGPAVFGAVTPGAPAATPGAPAGPPAAGPQQAGAGAATPPPPAAGGPQPQGPPGTTGVPPQEIAAVQRALNAPATATQAGYTFPADQLPDHVIPDTPIPAGLTFPDELVGSGDAERGRELYSRSACIGCHVVQGNPMSRGVLGPNLTHVASRATIGAGLYPNDARYLALWIKNTRMMKPGALMPVLGKGQIDPTTNQPAPSMGALDDRQIADIVAYLQALK